MRRTCLWWIAATALVAACGTDGTHGLDTGDDVVGNEDHEDPALGVEEGALSAAVDGDRLKVVIPVRVETAAAGDATVELMNLDNEVLASGSASFDLGEGGGPVEVSLPADDLPEAGAEEASRVIHYKVQDGASRTSGYRSLLVMLPKVDLRARIPSKLTVGSGAKVRVFAIDPFTHAPKGNVPVSLRLEPTEDAPEGAEAVEVQGTTDDEGSAVLDVPEQEEGSYTAKATAEEGAYAAALAESDVEVERNHRVLVSTDKPIYQPGQTMHIRALALKKPRLDAEAGSELTFEVYDGKGNMVYRKFAETNDFGIAGTTFTLAREVNMGHYQVKAHLGGTTTTRTVNVERYSLPKFEVSLDLDREFYLVGENLHGVVDVGYFFGKPVVDGVVEVQAITQDVETTTIDTFQGSTNADGKFEFDLQIPDYLVGQPLETGNGLILLQVKVTDTAGHVQEKSTPVVVAEQPIDLVAVPESGGVVPGLENAVYVFATDPLNRPVDADLTVTVDGAEVDVEPVGDGVGRFLVTPDGALSFHVSAATMDGATASEDFEFSPGADDGGLLLRTDASLYQVGETATVQVFATGADGRMFLDVIKDGQTWLTDAADLVDGVATFSLDLDPSLVGDVVIEAYRVGADAAIARDKKMIFVQDAEGLDITVTPDKPAYEPGEEATLEFEVTDGEGEPAAAALGVQIVDEAVYAVTEMKPGLLETYFLIQEALREPKYEIHGVHFDLAGTVTGDPEDKVAQVTAEASFAALSDASLSGEISSWDQVKSEVPGVLEPAYQARMEGIEADLQRLAEHGNLPGDDRLAEFLENQNVYYDNWGTLLRFEPEQRWDGWYATVRSAGPDETFDTWDDWSGEVVVTQDYRERWDFDGAADAAAGPPMAGGPDDEQNAVPDAPSEKNGDGEGDGPRVRKDFPETLYFNPALITDSSGKASITLNMADSITEWRVSSLANTKDGALGSGVDGVTVFQDFFVDIDFPATLTRNDEVSFPVAVYNYLPVAQTVDIQLESGSWFELMGSDQASVTVGPGEVTSVLFPVKVKTVGTHPLTVVGTGTEMSDAVQRVVEVVPDGKEERASEGGVLDGTKTHEIAYPAGLIPNSHDLLVKIYPGIMAQAVEGLDSMLRMPSGCFEQSTATNWPNTLVIDYLRQSGQASPEVELKAMDFLQQGYQRLLTFEVTGGGFVWFGDPSPANVILSAMGVMEFSDMAEVMEIDQNVIQRTARWLEEAQKADGSWHTDQGSEFATVQYDDVKTTAYVTWALAESAYGAEAVGKALGWLTPHAVDESTDVYALALMGNAFAHAQPSGSTTQAVLQRLADLAVVGEDGSVHWEYEGGGYNYDGPGVNGVDGTAIEITAMATQAFIVANAHLDLVEGSIAFLASNKDSFGNWGTTHATILSLRAMVMSLQNKTEEGEGTVTVSVNGVPAQTLEITEENRNVFHQMDLRDLPVLSEPNDVTVAYEGTGRLMYQVVSSWWVPGETVPPTGDALDIEVAYDKTQLAVNDTATGTATVTNTTQAGLSMVMVDLGLPPGFDVVPDKLEHAIQQGTIMKYELPGQQVSIYLESLAPGETLQVSWDLRAKYPVKAQAKSSAAYLYYDTENRSETSPVEFVVE
ncbi:MAG: MG2 domain-containing protein [Myxococcota bacterium]